MATHQQQQLRRQHMHPVVCGACKQHAMSWAVAIPLGAQTAHTFHVRVPTMHRMHACGLDSTYHGLRLSCPPSPTTAHIQSSVQVPTAHHCLRLGLLLSLHPLLLLALPPDLQAKCPCGEARHDNTAAKQAAGRHLSSRALPPDRL